MPERQSFYAILGSRCERNLACCGGGSGSYYPTGACLSQLWESGEDGFLFRVDIMGENLLSLITKHLGIIGRTDKITVVYTVDIEALAEVDPDQCDDLYSALLHHGLRTGVEYVMVDLARNEKKVQDLLRLRSTTKVIGCYHNVHPPIGGCRIEAQYEAYLRAEALGCDIVHLTQPTNSHNDEDDIQYLVQRVARLTRAHPPLIAFNTGIEGRRSQLLNRIMTPVRAGRGPYSHASTSQMSVADAFRGLFAAFILDPVDIILTGPTAAAEEVFVAVYRTGCDICQFTHPCHLVKTRAIVELLQLTQSHRFGGACINHLMGNGVDKHLQNKSDHATAIGEINLILPIRHGGHGCGPQSSWQSRSAHRSGHVAGLYGENTEWKAIYTSMEQNMSPRDTIDPARSSALVVGAGAGIRATIYALLQLGCKKIFLCSGIPQQAEEVAHHFNALFAKEHGVTCPVVALPSLHVPLAANETPPNIIVSSIPQEDMNNTDQSKLVVPDSWLRSRSGGLIVELGYVPSNKALIKQIHRIRQETGAPWIVLTGIDMLISQALCQLEVLVDRRINRDALLWHMRNTMNQHRN